MEKVEDIGCTPLGPPLAAVDAILRRYLKDAGPSGLLFPAANGKMVTDFRKSLDAVAERVGWNKGEVRSKAFRHTYCAARLQSLDNGAPVSICSVGKELGHGGDALVKRVYGHLGTVRHRADVVEYRIEQHQAHLTERLRTLCIA